MRKANEMQIVIDARRIHFDFTLNRDKHVILLQGKSGSYKTTLFEVLEHYYRYGKDSGLTVECEKKIVFIGYDSWKNMREYYLVEHSNQLTLIHEACHFFNTPEFAEVIKRNRTNQYLIITREKLKYIDVNDYEIKQWNKEGKCPWKFKSTLN